MNEILLKRIAKEAHQYIQSDAVEPENMQLAFGDFINGAKWALQNQWISVEEALPKYEERVLVAHQYGRQVVSLYKDNSHQYWGVTKDSPIGAAVTHWMPISSLGGGEE